MIDIRRILCPVDFSDTSRHALEHAVAIAKWYEAQIIALHVTYRAFMLQPPILFAEFPTRMAPGARGRQALEEQLHAWLEPANQAGVRTAALLVEGNPTLRVLEHATSLQASLIVMGTHGLSGFERVVLGSIAEKVLRKATCPVMTVPPTAVTAAKVPYARVLCPVDFSECSLAALRFAFSIAEESDAHLTILHVFDWPPDSDLLAERPEAPEAHQLVEEQARERLETLVPDEVRVWCKPATKVGYGKPYRRILELAEREGTDLIVIGVRGRGPLDLTLFGSTTNHVVRRASCPVLTLKQ